MSDIATIDEDKARFKAKRIELASRGELAAAIEYDSEGNWIGLLLSKNYEFADTLEQIHWANKVEY